MRYLLILLSIFLLFGCATAGPTVKQSKPKPPKAIKAPVEKKESKTVMTELVLRYPVPDGEISSPFGIRKGGNHRGVDIAAPLGTPVLACLEGQVIRAGAYTFAGGYGNSVMIKHGSNLYTYYAHLNQIEVKRNQKITAGQRIGRVGNSGKSRGSHLHLELIKDKKLLNPELYFEAKYVRTAREVLRKFKEGFPLSSCIKKLIGVP